MPYYCSLCGTKCDTHKRYEKHCQTAKHLKNQLAAPQPVTEPTPMHKCECGKEYTHRPSLSRHQRTCPVVLERKRQQQTQPPLHNTGAMPGYANHHGFQQFNIETVNNTVNNTNITNPVFNFNIYLNEHCREAVCIEEFCDTIVKRIKSLDDPDVNISFIDNRDTFDQVLGNLQHMNSVKRPIQTFQGEIVEKSRDDWRALSLERLNNHVTGITSQVNWAKFSGLPQPITSNELLQNMVALKAATEIHPPLRQADLGHLKKITNVPSGRDGNKTDEQQT